MLEKIYLVAREKELFEAWIEVFKPVDVVEPVLGDLFACKADAMVSPANSFGIMDGGIDLYIRDALGFETERRLQRQIIENYYGELPVGIALIVETDSDKWPYMVSAPTMRVPEDVSNTLNSYLAFRAVLHAVKTFNESNKDAIRSLVCPGLATGIGCMPAKKCAAQMRVAYNYISKPSRIPSYSEIHEVHRKLHRAI